MRGGDLHRGLGIGRDYSNWIKDRIARAQFKESVDYIVENVDRQIGRTTKSMVYAGVKTAIEYHLSLDMAKHLALMENNPRGHEYRCRLIEIEKAQILCLRARRVRMSPVVITNPQMRKSYRAIF